MEENSVLRGDAPSTSDFMSKKIMSNLPLTEKMLAMFPQSTAQMQIPYSHSLPTLSLGTGYDRRSVQDSLQDPLPIPILSNSMYPDFPMFQHQERKFSSSWGLSDVPVLSDSQKKVLENIMMRTNSCSSSNPLTKKSKPDVWSEDELDSLWIGVRRHGKGNWEIMLKDPKLRFSLQKTPDDLSLRWNEELVRIFDGSTVPGSWSNSWAKATKSTFSNLPDGIMARALNGSRFGPPFNFRNNLTDAKLGFPDLPELADKFGLMPSWHSDKLRSQIKLDASSGPGASDMEGGSLNIPNSFGATRVGSIGFNCSSSFCLQPEDEQVSQRYQKLPCFLPPSLNFLNEYHTNSKATGVTVNSAFPPYPDRGLDLYPSNTDDPGSHSGSTKKSLPHWLRDAVSTSKLNEPDLPPVVSAIARSVRLIYGEDSPAIPPFVAPGPLPSQPQDPRQNLKSKKKKKKRAKLNCSSSKKIFDLDHQQPGSSVQLLHLEPMISVPPADMCVDHQSASKLGSSSDRKANVVVSTSPEVLQFLASCDAPGPPYVPASSGTDKLSSMQINGPSDERHAADIPSIIQPSVDGIVDTPQNELEHTHSADSSKKKRKRASSNNKDDIDFDVSSEGMLSDKPES